MFSLVARKLAHLFPFAVRRRGESYFHQGKVRIGQGSAESVSAVVRGSENYDVRVTQEGDRLSLSCTCAAFAASGPCKHLWATILSSAAGGYLSNIDSVRNPGQSEEDEPEGALSLDLTAFRLPTTTANFVRPVAPPRPPKPAAWKSWIERAAPFKTESARDKWPANRQILYVIEVHESAAAGHLVVQLCSPDHSAKGKPGRVVPLRLQIGQIPALPSSEDREILAAIAGGNSFYGMDSPYSEISGLKVIRHPLSRTVVPLIVNSGRAYLRRNGMTDEMKPLAWDNGGAWHFELAIKAPARAPDGTLPNLSMTGFLRRGDEKVEVSVPDLITSGGHVFMRGLAAPVEEGTGFEWLLHLRRNGAIDVPAVDGDEFLATLLSASGLPPLSVPEHLRYEEVTVPPRPRLQIRSNARRQVDNRLVVEFLFDYGGHVIRATEANRGFFSAVERRFVHRDVEAEQAASTLLYELGVRVVPANYYQKESGWDMASSRLPKLLRTLLEAGWHVEADGKAFRSPGKMQMRVASGVDWFELYGDVEYGDAVARLPDLLEAVRRGENLVELSDGSFGMLPPELLRKLGLVAGMGTAAEGHIRFRPSQAGLLDALLAAQPEATFDKGFARIREEMHAFQGVEAALQPAGFVGQLRDYQREGLGWMDFLRRFSFGGCLADDMGVGKTPQVLAMLEQRRELRELGNGRGPSLVVVPRSLVFNWKQEAERFTPRLRVLDYTGLNRGEIDLSAFDVVLATYGTLRRDVVRLRETQFDYVVLDEAQAIKNANTESARAVRLLQAEHRLALSGTPIENHLGELWSLFEFLNPGMLGAASAFQRVSRTEGTVDDETRRLLSHALRPFILRRTKDQVARELPAKNEQTVYCELEPAQRKLYDDLRRHYRESLLSRIETEGLAKSKIMVLEALLRLRQAACHPGLIDPKRVGEPSAKLELLQEQLSEVLESGHKVLVFSQFTSLLKIVRDRLDAEGVVYEYLDGRTRDRQAKVERFQNDADCKLFLISLKAGGLGLNLTAAEYVFLLDPWWNPAVEAQAVDRAHRIGQKRTVFAYRLIARDTVEEKVLELQKSKRDLAAAIIGEDNALIRNLRREDLELLLS